MVALEDFDEAQLVEFFRKKFGKHTSRAMDLIPKFGPYYSVTAAKIIYLSYHNRDKGKLSEVLDLLEKHWNGYLKFRPTESETKTGSDQLTHTEVLFLFIYEKILDIHVIIAFSA